MEPSSNRVVTDFGTVALSGLVYGVGQDLKDRVFAALQSVRTKYDRRALSHPVSAFQRRYAFVSVALLFGSHRFISPSNVVSDRM